MHTHTHAPFPLTHLDASMLPQISPPSQHSVNQRWGVHVSGVSQNQNNTQVIVTHMNTHTPGYEKE